MPEERKGNGFLARGKVCLFTQLRDRNRWMQIGQLTFRAYNFNLVHNVSRPISIQRSRSLNSVNSVIVYSRESGSERMGEEKTSRFQQHTQSAGSTELPFNNLWFSSLVLPSLSLVLNGSSNVAAVRSGISVE